MEQIAPALRVAAWQAMALLRLQTVYVPESSGVLVNLSRSEFVNRIKADGESSKYPLRGRSKQLMTLTMEKLLVVITGHLDGK